MDSDISQMDLRIAYGLDRFVQILLGALLNIELGSSNILLLVSVEEEYANGGPFALAAHSSACGRPGHEFLGNKVRSGGVSPSVADCDGLREEELKFVGFETHFGRQFCMAE